MVEIVSHRLVLLCHLGYKSILNYLLGRHKLKLLRIDRTWAFRAQKAYLIIILLDDFVYVMEFGYFLHQFCVWVGAINHLLGFLNTKTLRLFQQ